MNCDAVVTHGGTQSNHVPRGGLDGRRKRLAMQADPAWRSQPAASVGGKLAADVPGRGGNRNRPRRTDGIIRGRGRRRSRPRRRESPDLVPGGGHCLAGTLAYADAVAEVAVQLNGEEWVPDVIVLPSGTGATQAGIIVGLQRLGWATRVIGVSVGRPNPRGTQAVAQAVDEGAGGSLNCRAMRAPIDFRDGWLCGGYEKAAPRVLETIKSVAERTGLILDPTYTGKAFAALIDMVENGEIRREERVLFWHTGGLLNLLASPYFAS